MRARARENAVWVALAVAATMAVAWLGLAEFGWNDYDNEARGAVSALVHGHLGAFFKLAPVYGGSLLERAPFALAPGLWGGGELAVYRMLALPCLLAAAALGLWLVAWMRRNERAPLACALALVLCTANPLTLLALEIGHPDELLGGALCVAAVLLATRGRIVWAGIALGLAVANKQWALLAIGPVLIALPARRTLAVGIAGAVSGALLAPFALFAPGRFTDTLHSAATTTGVTFQPWQLWWFLGHPGHAAHSVAGAAGPSSRMAPAWVAAGSHPLILAVALPLTLAAWMRLRRFSERPGGTAAGDTDTAAGSSESVALALLALLLLLRCVLDPWDNVYYPIPFVLALLAWEARRTRRPALLALGATVAVWAGHGWLGGLASQDVQAAFFLAWTAPLAIGLAVTLYGRAAHAPASRSVDDRELLGEPRQQLVSLAGHDHQILDPHPQPAG